MRNNKQIVFTPKQNEMFQKALALHQGGKLEQAEQLYKKLLISLPSHPKLMANLGAIAFQKGKFEDAVRIIGKSLAIAPNQPKALNNLGNALKDMNRLDEAVANYDRALVIDPHYADAYYNRGLALQDLNRLDEAVASYERAIAIDPNHAVAYYNRGIALKDLKQLEAAVASYDGAIVLNPNYADAYSNRGNALKDMNRLDEAVANYDRALAINPNHADAYWNKSLLKLLNGDYLEGWALYEWGWKSGQRKPSREFLSTLWLGEQALAGKTLLVYPEQGLGDYIQFIRYATMVEALGAKVVLEVPSALMAIASTLKGQFTLVETGKALPEIDFHCPVMSLPLAFKTIVETIPSQVPYLYADTNEWQQRLGEKTKPRIGLVWSGSVGHKNDHNRSIPLKTLKPLFELPVEFHCLQNEIRPDDAAFIASNGKIAIHQELLNDFSDTAALIEEMDLVITVDTSVAHLTGALGKEAWILLPYAPDFRWMLSSDDTPWYPNVKLFRQPEIGDWDGVINKIENALKMYQ